MNINLFWHYIMWRVAFLVSSYNYKKLHVVNL